MNRIDLEQLSQLEQRLREIWRRHIRIIISDSQEVAEVKQRLESILVTLASYCESGTDHSKVRLVARDLGTAQRQLAILGFVNVARVLERVEESLADLGANNSPDEKPQTAKRFEPPPKPAVDSTRIAGPHEEQRSQPHKPSLIWLAVHSIYGAIVGWSVMRAMTGTAVAESIAPAIPIVTGAIVGLLIGVLYRFVPKTTSQALLRLLTLVVWLLTTCGALTYLALKPAKPATKVTEVLEPVATPNEVPATATPIVLLIDEDPIDDISARVTIEIKRAEAAIKERNLGQAIDAFAAAVAIDRHHRLINDTAEKVIKLMLDEADRATEIGRWDRASKLVDDALSLANHFYLDTGAIKHTRSRHNSTARFVDTLPDDLKAINLAIGKRVKATLLDSDTIRGTIQTVSPSSITLDVNSGVGGGQVRFTRDYPLNEIQNIRVYGEGLIDPPKEPPTPTVAPQMQNRRRTIPQRRRRTQGPRRG